MVSLTLTQEKTRQVSNVLRVLFAGLVVVHAVPFLLVLKKKAVVCVHP